METWTPGSKTLTVFLVGVIALQVVVDFPVACGVAWCGVVCCVVVWCGALWCVVVWCGVVWCDVVLCGMHVRVLI